MSNEGPASLRDLLIVLDLEDTVVTSDPPRELTEDKIPVMLRQLIRRGVLPFLCSRNPPHVVHGLLEGFQLTGYFQGVFADYRPRDYQVRHALWKLKERGIIPPAVLFVDDYPENCRRVAALREHLDIPLYSIVYQGQSPHNLETTFTSLIESDFQFLRSISL